MAKTLKHVKDLEEAGLSRDQAETYIRVIAETIEDNVATRQDLEIMGAGLKQELLTSRAGLKQELLNSVTELKQEFLTSETNLRREIENTRTSLRQEIGEVRSELRNSIERVEHKIIEAEYRLVIKMGTIVTTLVLIGSAATTIAVKLF